MLERRERDEKKRRIVIRDAEKMVRELVREIPELIKQITDKDLSNARKWCDKGDLYLEMASLKEKIEILEPKTRKRLEERGIVPDDDRTRRKMQVQKWIEKLEAVEKTMGADTQSGYLKLRINEEGWK